MQIVFEIADFNNFSEERYLKANQDISDAVKKGLYTNGLEHFTKFGHKENRKLWPMIDIEITDLRKNIIRRVGENLEEFGNRSFIHTEAKMFLPLTAGLISNNNYDAEVLDLFSDENNYLLT